MKKSIFQDVARTFKLRKRASHLLKTGDKVLVYDYHNDDVIQGEIVDRWFFDKELYFQIENYNEIEAWKSTRWHFCKNIIKKIF